MLLNFKPSGVSYKMENVAAMDNIVNVNNKFYFIWEDNKQYLDIINLMSMYTYDHMKFDYDSMNVVEFDKDTLLMATTKNALIKYSFAEKRMEKVPLALGYHV